MVEKEALLGHFTGLRSEIDQREGGKAGRAASDERAIRLVTLHVMRGKLGPFIWRSSGRAERTYRHDSAKMLFQHR
jgi:hypothetical protein